MAVFRIERTRDYTVMSNHHLRNHELSLKAKGLLSMMLSLPDDWNYTTRGLAKICKEGVDAIGMKDGKYVGARTPYGYLKSPDDCHQLIVDPVAAEVVKTMFQWAAEGAGLNTIAVRLNEAGYLSPSHYKRTLGEITHENLVGNGHWQTRTVSKILRAEVYTGDLVQGVSKIIDHKQVRASADEWTTVRGTHEAIVSRELFDAVQKALDQAAQQAKDRDIHSWSPNLLKGKIFCAHCGHSLHRQKCVRKKTPEVYVYHCISNNRIKKGICPGVFIFEKELLDALADMIQEQLDTAAPSMPSTPSRRVCARRFPEAMCA